MYDLLCYVQLVPKAAALWAADAPKAAAPGSAGLSQLCPPVSGYSAEGGAVGGGLQWMGVVLHNTTAYNTM